MVSYQGLLSFPLIQQFLDTSIGRKMKLDKILGKYSEDLRCPNTLRYINKSKYSRLSLSRTPRDSLKYFEISVVRHIRFAELRKK